MIENKDRYRLACLRLIEKKVGWGDGSHWSNADFEKLSNLIYEKTNVLLSASTLKRVWGRVRYDGKPAISTLDALVNFIDYENWRAFVVQYDEQTKQETPTSPPKERNASKFRTRLIFSSLMVLVGLFVIFSFLNRKEEKAKTSHFTLSEKDFSFSSKPLTRSIPNSVIFTYDASKAIVDSVFIQQTWDANRRVQVPKDGNTHTAVYYEPGYYTAKLSIGGQVVKEHPLLVATDGWLATIDRKPIPIYLKKEWYLNKNQLSIPARIVEQSKISLLPNPPVVKFFNVGNFEPTSVSDFSFEVQVKNAFNDGSSACQFSHILLITDAMPIAIPLSIKGCVSDLNLMTVDSVISGKYTDLSKFGADLSNWVKVACRSDGKVLQFHVNNEKAFEAPLISKNAKIVGMAYTFMGTGSVKGIKLSNSSKMLYKAF
ncbi:MULTISPECIES: hypothetical protein [Olivibacter]|uniref:PKD domain-containing protein n=1 Tax=Olivibacter jilunii TaxID=985016 RepID=A0ABW6AVG9_9SPHI|nr:hypothetical protein [Olivibacter sp. UJ_SKK_5.1]MDX3913379.1 hypothetical protein [Pseudosphingobacterium sp.]